MAQTGKYDPLRDLLGFGTTASREYSEGYNDAILDCLRILSHYYDVIEAEPEVRDLMRRKT